MIYQATGSIRITGCSFNKIQKNFLVYFAVGSRVYIKKKAKLGILESVVLKKVYRTAPEKYQGVQPVISYVDTFNRVWIEDELTWEADAIDYAKVYWRRVEQDAQRLLEQGRCLSDPPCGS
jgi:hypothetical protein